MHDYHDGLPGYDPGQILHDGCGECEARAQEDDRGLGHLDKGNFYRAWARAAQWNRSGLDGVSRAEVPLLNLLWSVQIRLEAYADVPIGLVPNGWNLAAGAHVHGPADG
jgi:hypothetical protein